MVLLLGTKKFIRDIVRWAFFCEPLGNVFFEISGLELRAVGGIMVVLLEEHACALGQCCWKCLEKAVMSKATHALNTEWRNADMQESLCTKARRGAFLGLYRTEQWLKWFKACGMCQHACTLKSLVSIYYSLQHTLTHRVSTIPYSSPAPVNRTDFKRLI